MSLIYFLFDLFCDNNNIYSQPPQPSFLSRLKLWFNFILGLNAIFFCFQLIIIHYHTQKPTYLGSMGKDANLSFRFWRLSIFHFPLPRLLTAPRFPLPMNMTPRSPVLHESKDTPGL